MHFAEKGAYTGELSADMLKAVGCEYVIVGHSERRQYFGETDKTVNLRATAAVKAGLTAIICVGEMKDERVDGYTDIIVAYQTKIALKGLTAEELNHVVIAYEPVWAIGTGLTATDEPVSYTHLYGDIAAVEDVQKDHEGEPPQQGREAAADAGRQHLGAQVAPRAGPEDGGHGETAVPVYREGRRRGQRRHQRHGVRHQPHGAGKAPDEDGRVLRLIQHVEYIVQGQQEVRGRSREHPWPEGVPPVVCEHKHPPVSMFYG